MTRKLASSIERDVRQHEFMADLELVEGQMRDARTVYFRSRKYKNLGYRLMVKRDVFPPNKLVLSGQKGQQKKRTRPAGDWRWTNLTMQWKIDAMVMAAWPQWSPDDCGD